MNEKNSSDIATNQPINCTFFPSTVFFTISTFSLFLFFSLTSFAIAEYAIVGSGTSGNYTGDCQTQYCAISEFVPSGNGDCPICGSPTYWDSTTLPNGHYYWLGSVTVLECVDNTWNVITSTPAWYFNYDPLDGDQDAVAGAPCNGCSTQRAELIQKCGSEANIAEFIYETCVGFCKDTSFGPPPDECKKNK